MKVRFNKQTKEFQVSTALKLGEPTVRRTVDDKGKRPDSYYINLAPQSKFVDIEVDGINPEKIAIALIAEKFKPEIESGEIDLSDLQNFQITTKLSLGIKAGANATSREISSEKFLELLDL